MVKPLPIASADAASRWLSRGAAAVLVCLATGCVSPLYHAIRADDPVAVRAVLAERHLKVNGSAYRDGCTYSGLTPLGFAAQRGRLEAARALLEAGADVNVRMAMGALAVTPLGIAAEEGHLALVELLLQHGAEVNAGHVLLPPFFRPFGPYGRGEIAVQSPLLLALRAGHRDSARALLTAGADANLQAPARAYGPPGTYGRPVEGPAIQVAAAQRDVEMVKLLLDKGARVDAPVWTFVQPLFGPPGPPPYGPPGPPPFAPPVPLEEPFSRWLLYDYDVRRDVNATAYYDILQLVLPLARTSRPAAAAVLFSTNVMVTVDGRVCGAPPEGVDEIAPGTHTVEVTAVRLPSGLLGSLRSVEGLIPAQPLSFEAGRFYLLKPVLERLSSGRLVPKGVDLLCF